MFPRISAQRTSGLSLRTPEHFLPSPQPICFRNILIRKMRPQLAANHIDADSFDLRPRVFILMRKNVGAGVPTVAGSSCSAAILAAPCRLETGVKTRNSGAARAGGAFHRLMLQ